jgi:hypothetical protein
MSSDFPEPFPTYPPIQTRGLALGNFVSPEETVRAGTAALFELSGDARGAPAQLLELQGAAGGPAPPSLRVGVLRVR